jgi:hypothetical protein
MQQQQHDTIMNLPRSLASVAVMRGEMFTHASPHAPGQANTLGVECPTLWDARAADSRCSGSLFARALARRTYVLCTHGEPYFLN